MDAYKSLIKLAKTERAQMLHDKSCTVFLYSVYRQSSYRTRVLATVSCRLGIEAGQQPGFFPMRIILDTEMLFSGPAYKSHHYHTTGAVWCVSWLLF